MHSPNLLPVDPDRLTAIAKKWGTPTYVYSEKAIRDQCRKLTGLFSDVPVSWLYAVKANDNPHIVRVIAEEGLGFDTVSFEEALLCLELGTDPGDIFYTENNMTEAEMNGAVEEGIVLNIGSVDRLKAFCEQWPGTSCSIRLKPDIGDGHHVKVDTGNIDSKFGIRMDLIDEVIALAESHKVTIRGLHAHIGSGIQKPENLIYELNVLLEASGKFKDLEFLNFGGGIPIPYRSGDPEFDVERFAEMASERFRTHLEESGKPLRFYFEPGRWIVGASGILLAEVTTVKDQGRKTFLGTNTGFNHLLRPALYDAYHEVINISAGDDEPRNIYDIAGNICESGDILAAGRSLPETNTGDILAILDAGAYGMTMASSYNRRALPAEVMVTEQGFHKTIRSRKSARQTVREFLNDTGVATDND
ncbi:diaminopimelate decarboxylase [Balneolales bacterium ANBcel1]|nr:diaminopimelate decarboxylase [Balneolales bacterium ANBcel1]